MNLAKTFYPRQSVTRKQIEAVKRDCTAKTNWAFSPPIVPGDFVRQVKEIAAERRAG